MFVGVHILREFINDKTIPIWGRDRYWRLPTKVRYSVGSGRGVPELIERDMLGSIGELTREASSMEVIKVTKIFESKPVSKLQNTRTKNRWVRAMMIISSTN